MASQRVSANGCTSTTTAPSTRVPTRAGPRSSWWTGPAWWISGTRSCSPTRNPGAAGRRTARRTPTAGSPPTGPTSASPGSARIPARCQAVITMAHNAAAAPWHLNAYAGHWLTLDELTVVTDWMTANHLDRVTAERPITVTGDTITYGQDRSPVYVR